MLYIRTDMNEDVATGHMMRCLAIADAAAVLGESTTFILADEQAAKLVQERECHTIVLNTSWNDMESELEKLKRVIDKHGIRVLLVDSYMVTEKYLCKLSEWLSVAYIDDLNMFTYPVQTLICYVCYWEKFDYNHRYCSAELLLGPEYAPLRGVFTCCEKKNIRPQVKNILLLSGGSDRLDILEKLLGKICKEKYQSIDVICGKYYIEYGQLCCQYSQYKNIHFYKDVKNVEDFMKKADMAVSAGGTTLYELCACGTPTVSYSFADNQLDNVLKLEQDGVIDYAGDARYEDIFTRVSVLLAKYDSQQRLRESRSRKMQMLVDGKGAGRIAVRLINMYKDY